MVENNQSDRRTIDTFWDRNIMLFIAIVLGILFIIGIGAVLSLVFESNLSDTYFYTYLTALFYAALVGLYILISYFRNEQFPIRRMFPSNEVSKMRLLFWSRFTLIILAYSSFIVVAVITVDGFVTMNPR